MPSTSSRDPSDESQPQSLAEELRSELAAAGLPVLSPDHAVQPQQASGVAIEVEGNDVWLSWQVNGALGEASQRAFVVGAYQRDTRNGFVGHPALRHHFAVNAALSEAIAAILRSLGYSVQVDAEEYRPGELLVSERAPGPHWQDPAVPPLAGSAGYSPGVRVRLLSGEYAGSVTTIVSGTYRLSAPGPPLRYRVKHPNGDGELDVAPGDVTLATGDS